MTRTALKFSGVADLARAAREAARTLAKTTAEQRRGALERIADAIVAREAEVLAANAADVGQSRHPRRPAASVASSNVPSPQLRYRA